MDLGEAIIRMKGEKKMTTEVLAKLSGVPKGTINKILNGETQNPRARTLRQLARALGCDAQTLYGAEEDNPVTELQEHADAHILSANEKYLHPADVTPTYDFTIHAPDDSMTAMRISEGDTIFIKKQADVPDGKIALLSKGTKRFIAIIYHLSESLLLITQKTGEAPRITFSPDAKVEGVAVAFQGLL